MAEQKQTRQKNIELFTKTTKKPEPQKEKSEYEDMDLAVPAKISEDTLKKFRPFKK